MSIYELKICKEEDKEVLIDFIRKYWQKDHVFVKSEELLKFQHYNANKKEFSFVLGYNTISKEIDGIVGLIPLSHFDPNLEIYNQTWGGIWKVRQDVDNDEIGILGLLLFEEFNKYSVKGGIGMSEIATKFYKLMKYNTCTLSQYYILNANNRDFKIAVIPNIDNINIRTSLDSGYKIKKINNILNISETAIKDRYWPRKSITYLFNRFQLHPFYLYTFYGIYDENKTLKTVFVLRAIVVNNSKVLRIVDILGVLEGLKSIKKELVELLKKESAEYIDIMNFGIDSEVFMQLGFEQLDARSETIIPNYFEPFIQENILIHAGYKAQCKYVMFKADSDQDRPNLIDLK